MQTTVKTWPPPSGAIAIGVSQFVKEPHTWTCRPPCGHMKCVGTSSEAMPLSLRSGRQQTWTTRAMVVVRALPRKERAVPACDARIGQRPAELARPGQARNSLAQQLCDGQLEVRRCCVTAAARTRLHLLVCFPSVLLCAEAVTPTSSSTGSSVTWTSCSERPALCEASPRRASSRRSEAPPRQAQTLLQRHRPRPSQLPPRQRRCGRGRACSPPARAAQPPLSRAPSVPGPAAPSRASAQLQRAPLAAGP